MFIYLIATGERRMMLTQIGAGESARIVAIDGGHTLRRKLYLRVLFEGGVVRMISNNGPITIEVDRNMISIGRRMAQKIRVMGI